MKQNTIMRRLASLALALVLAVSLAPAALATGMGSFTKEREYPGFSDVKEGDWFYNDVRSAYELGLINGGDGKFNPGGMLTLAEAVTMAVNVSVKYYGDDFTPGGSPWYANAVAYAEESNIIPAGRYTDFTQPATRSDVARMFANSLSEFERINRITWIPDVAPDTPFWSYIYTLYNAGVLAGDADGSFRPGDTIKRSEAAAILNRVALPEKRLSVSLPSKAAGQVVQAADGSFSVTISNTPTWPEWTIQKNETDGDGSCSMFLTSNGVSFQVQSFKKTGGSTAESMVEGAAEYIEGDYGGVIDNDGIYGSWTRGMDGYSFDYTWTGESGQTYDGHCSCVENSGYIFVIWQDMASNCSNEAYYSMVYLLMSFDIAL